MRRITADSRGVSSLLVLAVLLCGSATRGQNVIPAGYGIATSEASSHGHDLGRYAPMRSQYIYGTSTMPGAPLSVQLVVARPDGGRVLPGGHVLDIEMGMSSLGAAPSAGYSYSFAANRGPDFRSVMQRRRISFPSAAGARPQPFGVSFPLDTPFTYQGGAFLVEFKTYGSSYDYFDYYLDAVATTGVVRPATATPVTLGTGCPPDFRFWSNPQGQCTGGLLYNYGYTGIPGRQTSVVDVMGLSTTSAGSLALPFDLARFGAPGCMIYNDMLGSNMAFSSPSGTDGYTVSVWGSVPSAPSLIGATIYNQWLALDPSYNAFGVAASPSVQVVFRDGTFQGQSDCLHLFTYGRGGGVVFTGDEGAARFADGRALVLELR